MTPNPRGVSSAMSPTRLLGRGCARLSRLGVALLLSLGLVLTAAACGMNVQTNKPYTPADGVNLDVASVHVRNLLILCRDDGTGYLSGSMVSTDRDALVGVSGNPIKVDGSNGAAFTVTLPDPVALGNGVLVVLTNRPLIELKSADLKPGLTARLQLQFSNAGEATLNTVVIDADQPPYETITPSPSASQP